MTNDERELSRPEGALVRPAQGNALGKVGRGACVVGPTGQQFARGRGERLALWADTNVTFAPAPQGVAL
ncbi:MAG: hypothetical protein WAU84_03360, partial [Thermoguttaceae bacterium]